MLNERYLESKRIWVEVDLSAIRENYVKMQDKVQPNCKLLVVLKANAYGLGASEIARLMQKTGVDLIGVASFEEALSLIHLNLKILILGNLLNDEIPLAIKNDVILPITDFEIAEKINQYAKKYNKIAECNLLIDTGMGRLGILQEKALAEIKKIVALKHIKVTGIFSHFSSSDDAENNKTMKQINVFKELLDDLKKSNISFDNIHIANSQAVNNFNESHIEPFNLIRTGINLYGACENNPLGLIPAITLKSKVVSIRKLLKGASVGYSETYVLHKDKTIATVSAGYADGVPFAIGNKFEVIINDTKCPVVGRVSMDYITVDVSELQNVKVEDEVIIIGKSKSEQISLADIAKIKQTNVYDILCAIGPRVHKVYKRRK